MTMNIRSVISRIQIHDATFVALFEVRLETGMLYAVIRLMENATHRRLMIRVFGASIVELKAAVAIIAIGLKDWR